MTEQDWYLQQCQITQYVLRKPTVFKGEMATQISEQIRLIVVGEQKPMQKIYFDILRAINLDQDQVLVLTPAQLIVSPDEIKQVVWFIDTQPDERWQNQLIITTTSLETLANAPQQKRQLWHQLCQYEDYFHPN
ncbi:DNA polymerase III subunit psi [uncultured Gilliamella sp.]|uniref:DNA polymerase III subunit psi n=1 Tax=uncultured Gilliamella sp. TaxID=1193505 RepID=UPI0025FE046D|nr:DNA polymerase III subunit psi [uncultured Gilliamella sp.]